MKLTLCISIYVFFVVQCYCNVDTTSVKIKADSITHHLQTQNVSLDSAFVLVSECTELYRSIGEWRSFAYSLFGKSIIYGYKNDFVNEIKYMDSVIMYDQYLCEQKDIIYFGYINGLFQYYNSLGLRVQGNQVLKRAMKDLNQVSNAELASLLKANLASEYKKIGDYKTALDLYSQIYEQADRVHDKAEALMNISLIQDKLGMPGKSKSNINNAMKMIDEFESLPYINTIIADIIIAKGSILLNSNNFDELNSFFRLHESFFKTNEDLLAISFYHLKARSELYQREFQAADFSINNALAIIDTNFKDYNNYNILDLEKIYLDEYKINMALGKNEKAWQALEKSLNLLNFNFEALKIEADSHLNLDITTKALCEWIELLKLNESEKENDKIFSLYSEIFRLQKVSYSITLNQSYEQYWAQSNMKILSEAIQYFSDQEDFNKVFQLMEKNKSNLLVESMTDEHAKGKARIPLSYLERESSYLSNINFFKLKIIELKKDSSFSDQVADLKEAISINQLKFENLVDSLEILYPEYHSIKYKNENLKPKQVQAKLQKNEGFVEYFVSNDLAIAAVFTQENFNIITLNLGENYSEALSKFASKVRLTGKGLKDLNELSKNLHESLLSPIIDFLPAEINTLFIVQDGALSNLPFSVLQDEKGVFMLNKYSISYQYSAELWSILKKEHYKEYKYDWTGFAYDVEGEELASERECANLSNSSLLCSKKEIEQISNLFHDRIISTSDKTLNKFLEKAEHSKIIHLATHSCLDLVDYNLSRIYFNDSYLTYSDIRLNDFDVELTVVSSCESGYGKIIEGEGAMSIAKAFFQAGSKSTLVSLWPVDDCSTANIMQYFYQNLENGDNKSLSLKKAKLKYLETAHPSRTDPYYWAGFVLVGNEQAILSVPSHQNILVFIGIALILIILSILLKKKFF